MRPGGARHRGRLEQQAWRRATFRDETTLLPRHTPQSLDEAHGDVRVLRSSPHAWRTQLVAGAALSLLLLPVLWLAVGQAIPSGADLLAMVGILAVPFAMSVVSGLWWLIGPSATLYFITSRSVIVDTRWRRTEVDWSSIHAVTLVGGPMSWRGTYFYREGLPRLRVWGAGRSRTLPPILLWGQAFDEAERDLRAACREHDVRLRREDI